MSLWLSTWHLRILSLLIVSALAFSALVHATSAAEQDSLSIEENANGNAEAKEPQTHMILGVSWQPGYCQTRPKARECRDFSGQDPNGRRFSLHGLWHMKKSYCGVDAVLKAKDKARKWLELPDLALAEPVKTELAAAMPGVASGLDRHEWVMHGTCSGRDAGAYYSQSLALLSALNRSRVKTLFETRIGTSLGEGEIKAAFDEAFGKGAGEKVKMRCRKVGERQVITGLTIGLGQTAGSDGAQTDLAALMARAATTAFGCSAGTVEAAGTQ